MASDRRLWVVIPAAGRSSRFRAAGYWAPKPMLFVDYKGVRLRMLEHIANTMPNGHRIYGLPEGCDINGGARVTVTKTRGQADSILQCVKRLPADDRVLISDCDVLLSAEDITRIIKDSSCYEVTMAVTPARNPAMSYIDLYPFPRRVAEKKVISGYGIIGVRLFQNVGRLRSALSEALANTKGDDVYLSDAINRLDGPWRAVQVLEWTDWGTPEALKASGARITDPKH